MTLKTRPIDQVPPLRLMLPLPLPLRALRRLARGAAALGIVGLLLGGCVVAPAQTADGYPYPGAGEATSTYPAGGQAAQAVDPPGRVGRLSQLQGTVWVREAGEREWSAARRNRPLTQGDSLHTERGARAELQIGSSTLRLDGDSRLEVLRLDDAQVQLGLDAGALALRTRAPEVAREFSIETDAGSFQPLQPGHVRIDARRQSTLAGVWSGSLRFEAADSTLDLQAGQRAEFWREGNATHYSWVAPGSDAFGEWAQTQDRADEREWARLGQQQLPAEMTGIEDLGRHGVWQTHPEYGAVWQPSGVAGGWAPYRYGHWAWVAPWGWTWIDDAPWGFAPFHYGRWLQWNGRWAWAPGQYVSRPVYAPALVAWFGGGNASVGISIGGGPAVGWIPLAPWEPYWPGYYIGPRYRERIDPRYGERARIPAPPSRARALGFDRGNAFAHAFANAGAPGGVTFVSRDVLRERRPVDGGLAQLDPRRWQELQRVRPGGNLVSTVPGAVPGQPRGAIPGEPRGAAPGQMPGAIPGQPPRDRWQRADGRSDERAMIPGRQRRDGADEWSRADGADRRGGFDDGRRDGRLDRDRWHDSRGSAGGLVPPGPQRIPLPQAQPPQPQPGPSVSTLPPAMQPGTPAQPRPDRAWRERQDRDRAERDGRGDRWERADGNRAPLPGQVLRSPNVQPPMPTPQPAIVPPVQPVRPAQPMPVRPAEAMPRPAMPAPPPAVIAPAAPPERARIGVPGRDPRERAGDRDGPRDRQQRER